MVLVDTCVWVLSFAGREPFESVLDGLLARDQVAGHDLVYGELLIGGSGGRGKFLATYRLFRRASIVPHEEVVTFVKARGLHGRGLSWIDAHLLASTLISQAKLWTADEALAAVAKDLGIAYER